ncbi:MAG: acetylxylan esterase, partial [Clostridia bacterium]
MMDRTLQARNLPDLQVVSREERLRRLQWEIYGETPKTGAVSARLVDANAHAFADQAVQEHLQETVEMPIGTFSFPFTLIYPKRVEKCPVFLLINFRSDIPDLYLPAEELLQAGYAIAMLDYQTVAPDAAGSCALTEAVSVDDAHGWGRIGMWAWAASRVMDVLETRAELDAKRVAVCGHSRLGKTALWCGAQDARFSCVISNDSGCAGAALHRGKIGENVAAIVKQFPFWFCAHFAQYAGREQALPFDQHFLLSLIAPRRLYVASAVQDEWADPLSEYLCCRAASAAYEGMGLQGLVS